MTPQELQKQYEETCDAAAVASFIISMRDSAGKGDAEAPRAQRLMLQMYEGIREHIQVQMDVATRGKGGVYKNWLRRLGAERAAFIAMQLCISITTKPSMNRTHRGISAQRVLSQIGRAYETEVRVTEAEEVNPMYMDKIRKQIKSRATKSMSHIRKTYNVAYDRVMKGELDTSLSPTETVQVGKFGLEACVAAGLVHVRQDIKGGMHLVSIDSEVESYLHGYGEDDAWRVFDRANAAMLCPPQPWTNLEDGGYYSQRRQRLAPMMNIHRIRPAERRNVREQFTAEKMPLVFETANYLQSIPFQVHRPTQEAVQRIWEGR